MTSSIQAIVDLLRTFWQWVRPFVVIPVFARGARLTLGTRPKILAPGFHLLMPFAHSCDVVNVVPWVEMLAIQSVTSKDGVSLHVSATITCAVEDVELYHLRTESGSDSVYEAARGVLGDFTRRNRSGRFLAGRCDRTIEKAMRVELLKWGVHLISVKFPNRVKARAYRLIGGNEG